MRELIDEVDPEDLMPLLDDFFRPLQRGKHLERYRVLGGRHIVTLDGERRPRRQAGRSSDPHGMGRRDYSKKQHELPRRRRRVPTSTSG